MHRGDEVKKIDVGPVTRRDALKKIGVGAAVAWTAPTVLSITSPAFAAGSGLGADCRNYYVDQNCNLNALVGCNGKDPTACFAGRLHGGGCVCIQRVDCQLSAGPGCDTQSCASLGFPGAVCVETCCDVIEGKPKFQCLPLC